jgi:hypothetical protein
MGTRIVGIDKAGITEPRNDGTRGSGLYDVPLMLNEQKSNRWEGLLAGAWDSPLSGVTYTLKHRRGILSVAGDRVLLRSTTIEEVRDVHLALLKQLLPIVDQAEQDEVEHERRDRVKALTQSQDFRTHVDAVADDIDFD